jgi:hypothetical protein
MLPASSSFPSSLLKNEEKWRILLFLESVRFRGAIDKATARRAAPSLSSDRAYQTFFCKPAVDRSEKLASLLLLALVVPETRHLLRREAVSSGGRPAGQMGLHQTAVLPQVVVNYAG